MAAGKRSAMNAAATVAGTGTRLARNTALASSFAYRPPNWAVSLCGLPKVKLQLSRGNTPIHPWQIPDVAEGYKIFVKRDDYTGLELSGNKIRKLDFLLGDAVVKGCHHVVTCGAIQSNHCRIVAAAARMVGLQPHLLLRADNKADEAWREGMVAGNVVLNGMFGANMYVVPRVENAMFLNHLKPRMERLVKHIREWHGEETYVIGVGGSDEVGLFGYIDAWQEMSQQGVLDTFDDVVVACGTGGTLAGLAIANFLTNSRLRVHGVCVCDNATYFHQHINEMLVAVGLDGRTCAEKIVDVIEGYKGPGYGKTNQQMLDYSVRTSQDTGIVLDPTYTTKAVFGLVEELRKNPSRFRGKNILFIHTGGVFGMMDGRMETFLYEKLQMDKRLTVWEDLYKLPAINIHENPS